MRKHYNLWMVLKRAEFPSAIRWFQDSTDDAPQLGLHQLNADKEGYEVVRHNHRELLKQIISIQEDE